MLQNNEDALYKQVAKESETITYKKIVVRAKRIVELRGERNMSPVPYWSLGFCPASW